jgi:hypothetical protein
MVTTSRKYNRCVRTPVRAFLLVHHPPDLLGQDRDEFQSGAFRVRRGNPPAIVQDRQTSLSVTDPRYESDADPSACIRTNACSPPGNQAVDGISRICRSGVPACMLPWLWS